MGNCNFGFSKFSTIIILTMVFMRSHIPLYSLIICLKNIYHVFKQVCVDFQHTFRGKYYFIYARSILRAWLSLAISQKLLLRHACLKFQEIVKHLPPYSRFKSYVFWLPAWWALWLLWWPLIDESMFQCIYGYLQSVFFFLVLFHCCILLEIKLTTTIYYE